VNADQSFPRNLGAAIGLRLGKGFGAPPASRHGALIGSIAILASLVLGVGFASATAPTVTIDPTPTVSYFSAHVTGTVDPEDENTNYYFQYSKNPGSVGWTYGAFQGPIAAGSGTTSVSDDLTGLEFGTAYVVRLIAENGSGEVLSPEVSFETKAIAPMLITIGNPTEVTATSAHFSGTINPEGSDPVSDVDWHFLCTPDCPGLAGHIPADTSSHQVSANATGLQPNTDYTVSLVASNATGQSSAGPESFSTSISAPGAVTRPPSDLAPTSATIRGAVDPYGFLTTYYFEYGTTENYGARVPLNYELAAGKGHGPSNAEQQIAGLQPNTEYHYRVVASSTVGQSTSQDRVFTTPPMPTATTARSYEMVSPVDKGGSNIDVQSTANFQASPDGNRLVFSTKTALGGGVPSEAGPLLPRYATSRNASGWSGPVALDPAQIPGSPSLKTMTTFAISEDGSTALVGSLKAAAPGATDGDSNLYLRDTATGAFTTIASTPGPFYDRDSHFPLNGLWLGGTPDFSRVVVSGINSALLPGTPVGSLYEWTGSELRLVSIQPNGEPFPERSTGGELTERESHYVSEDGSKVFFNNGVEGYVRKDGQTTVALGGLFMGASRDGSVAFYDPYEENKLYRRDLNTETSTLVAPNVEAGTGVYQISENGDYAYFRSPSALAPGAPEGGTKVYVWHNGQIDYIARLDEAREAQLGEYMASPSGRYFAFNSYTQLATYDNSSVACQDLILADPGTACREIYRYDAGTSELVCASCRLDNRRPTGNAHMGNIVMAEFSRHFPRSMLDSGEVLFDTPEPLSAFDSNSRRDVYSFDGAQATLISAGRGDGDSQLADASADGKNIFFTTDDQLVGVDIDTLTDVYDARIGGGLASQNPPPARGECIRDDCKATPGAGPELPFGGSEGVNGAENVKAGPRRRCAKGSHKVKKRGKVRCAKQHKGHSDRRQGR
jgi:hypothetical protein